MVILIAEKNQQKDACLCLENIWTTQKSVFYVEINITQQSVYMWGLVFFFFFRGIPSQNCCDMINIIFNVVLLRIFCLRKHCVYFEVFLWF